MTQKDFVNLFKELLKSDRPVAWFTIDKELLARFFDAGFVVGGQLRPTDKKDELVYEATFFIIPNVEDAPAID